MHTYLYRYLPSYLRTCIPTTYRHKFQCQVVAPAVYGFSCDEGDHGGTLGENRGETPVKRRDWMGYQ